MARESAPAKSSRWRRRLVAYLLTPAILVGVAGFFGSTIVEFLKSWNARTENRAEDELKEVREELRELAHSPPKTSADADLQIRRVSALERVYPSGDAHDLLVAWRTDLETQKTALLAAENAEAEKQRQVAAAEEAKGRRDEVAAKAAQAAAAKSAGEVVLAQKRAQEAAARVLFRADRTFKR